MNGIIIVLGSPNDISGNLSSIAVERCNQALLEYTKHRDYMILLTGGYGEHFNKTEKPHAFYTAQYLCSKGISEDSILAFVESSNTFEDVKLSKHLIEKYNPKNIIVVTSDFHHDRVKYLLEQDLPERKLKLSCSKTNLPKNELNKIINHETKALTKLKIS
jgi:uncharacterized SAM-binding protein YcdF (DUF218 family)